MPTHLTVLVPNIFISEAPDIVWPIPPQTRASFASSGLTENRALYSKLSQGVVLQMKDIEDSLPI